ncbi:MAG: dTDP-4-amino-4,6-dideoxygalactose transaminase [Flavobacteriaceae bacterium]|nr:dTDP-4-amino-4,6-dideoxygalactose transaminase [Flavobacteriaceae bacterium]
MIELTTPCKEGCEIKYINKALESNDFSGSGTFNNMCQNWFKDYLGASIALTTSSCSHALDMSALILDIKKGDEVIMSSFNFVSAANSFAARGAKIIFIDVNPDTMNLNEELLEKAISKKTKAIVVMHYAGLSCEMDLICEIARKYEIPIIEDCAHSIGSKYKNKFLGTFGEISTFSFHSTKNLTSGGEGGLLCLNNKKHIKLAEIIREKGTNRSQFIRGEIDKYSWVNLGSSYLMNDLSAAYLYGQLTKFELIQNKRHDLYNQYNEELKALVEKDIISIQKKIKNTEHSAHLFYIILKTPQILNRLKIFLKKHKIEASTHYVPLHSSYAGKKYGDFHGNDNYTSKLSVRLLRLPLHYALKKEEVSYVCQKVKEFFK